MSADTTIGHAARPANSGPMVVGWYVGRRKDLQRKSALVFTDGVDVAAQFDDVETGLGFGWHAFTADEFLILENGGAQQ